MATFLNRPISTFEQSPQGSAQAVLCDVEDRGLQHGDRGDYYSIELSFQLSKRMKQGTGPRYLISRSYTQSLHPKSKLSAVVEALLGRPLTQTERVPGRFDLDTLIGMSCILEIYHEEKDGQVRAKIKDGALALMEGQVAFPIEGYTRKRDRDQLQKGDTAGPLGDLPPPGPTYGERPAPLPPTAAQRLAETEAQLKRIKESGQVKTSAHFEQLKDKAKEALEAEDETLPF